MVLGSDIMEYSNGGAWMQIEPKGLFLHFVSILIIYKYNTLEALPPAEKGANPYSHTQKWIVIILFYYKILKKNNRPKFGHPTHNSTHYSRNLTPMHVWLTSSDDELLEAGGGWSLSKTKCSIRSVWFKKKYLTGWFFAIDLSIMFE